MYGIDAMVLIDLLKMLTWIKIKFDKICGGGITYT